ncbi:MAG: hypothetical protein K8T25_20995 [Planctomycetia bacterium]|nr:hypothetical protein [Planctomycetia bacterium]
MRTRTINLALLVICCVLLSGVLCGCHHRVKASSGCSVSAISDIATTAQDVPRLIDVLANDTASQAGTEVGPSGIASVTATTAQGGTAVISGTQILYTPPPAPTGGPTDVKNISTGINDATGDKLADNELDTDYIIAPGGTGGRVGDVPRAERNLLAPPYITDDASTASTWLLLSGGDVNGSAVPPGTYFWDVKVNATGFAPSTMQIVGLRVAFDNQLLAIYVNDVLILPNPVNANPSFSFVTIGDVGLGAFKSGVNKIRFVVNNTGQVNTDMALRVEGLVQGVQSTSITAPFVDTFDYFIADPCGVSTDRATVAVHVTAPTGTTATGPAQVLLVNNSSTEVRYYVAGTGVDVLQPHGKTVGPINVDSGTGVQIRVVALLPTTTLTTDITADMVPDGLYTIIYTDPGDGSAPTVELKE